MNIDEIKKRHDLTVDLAEQKADMGSIIQAVSRSMRDIPDLIAEVGKLRAALENLLNEQNGPPLPRHEKTWQAAMNEAERLIYGDK